MSLTVDIDDDFFPALRAMSAALGAQPLHLLAVWYSESGVRANAWNNGPATVIDKTTGKGRPPRPEEKYNASGLFQAMPATLKGLGYPSDHASFRALTATQQLAWALRYYLPYRGKLGSIGAIYVANFLPALIDHAGDPAYVLTDRNGRLPWAYTPNAAFDANRDGRITVGELESAVQRNARGPRWDELVSRYEASDPAPDTLPAPPETPPTATLPDFSVVYAMPDPPEPPPDDVA